MWKLKFFNRICVFFIFICLLFNIEFSIDWPGSQWTSSHDIMILITWWVMTKLFSNRIFLKTYLSQFLLIGISLMGSMTWAVVHLKLFQIKIIKSEKKTYMPASYHHKTLYFGRLRTLSNCKSWIFRSLRHWNDFMVYI